VEHIAGGSHNTQAVCVDISYADVVLAALSWSAPVSWTEADSVAAAVQCMWHSKLLTLQLRIRPIGCK